MISRIKGLLNYYPYPEMYDGLRQGSWRYVTPRKFYAFSVPHPYLRGTDSKSNSVGTGYKSCANCQHRKSLSLDGSTVINNNNCETSQPRPSSQRALMLD